MECCTVLFTTLIEIRRSNRKIHFWVEEEKKTSIDFAHSQRRREHVQKRVLDYMARAEKVKAALDGLLHEVKSF